MLSNTLKQAWYNHQCQFLTECLQHKVIPNGLKFNAHINRPGKPSSRFHKRVEGIFTKTSIDIMTLLLGQFSALLRNLNKTLEDLKQELKQIAGESSLNRVLSRLNIESKRQERLLTNKREKKLSLRRANHIKLHVSREATRCT